MSHRTPLLVLTLALIGTAPCLAENRPASRPDVSAADIAQRIHQRVNAERRKRGLTTLAWDAKLATIAAGHSHDMAQRNYLNHDSPEGHGFDQRYRHAGYACEVRVGHIIHTGAENLAVARLYNSVTWKNGVAEYNWNSAADIARRTVDGWMHSTGHRENILTSHWRRHGIGIKIAPDNRVLVTQNFC